MMRTEDLKRVTPEWIKFSEDVRADPDAWNTSGDSYTKASGAAPVHSNAQPALLCWVALGAVTEGFRPGCAGARRQAMDSRSLLPLSSCMHLLGVVSQRAGE
jgi:hypothetical protein